MTNRSRCPTVVSPTVPAKPIYCDTRRDWARDGSSRFGNDSPLPWRASLRFAGRSKTHFLSKDARVHLLNVADGRNTSSRSLSRQRMKRFGATDDVRLASRAVPLSIRRQQISSVSGFKRSAYDLNQRPCSPFHLFASSSPPTPSICGNLRHLQAMAIRARTAIDVCVHLHLNTVPGLDCAPALVNLGCRRTTTPSGNWS